MISNNKESLTQIEDDLKNIKNNKKDESLPKESDTKRCNFFNRGYCKLKQSCPLLHPKVICVEEKCLNKECKKRHPNICKHWQTGLCKFGILCEFTHPKEIEIRSESSNQDGDESPVNDIVNNTEAIDTYIDYDNIDSDDDIDQNILSNSCECDKCDFKTTNKMHLKLHKKLCHKKIEIINDYVTKKRKSTDGSDDSISSSKKTKNDLVSKKEGKFACDECNQKTHSENLLKKHKETSHFD